MIGTPRLRRGLPVAPGAMPLIGHLGKAWRGMPELVRRAHDELGPVFWISAAGTWVLMCTGPEAPPLLKSKSFSSAHLQTVSPIVAGESLLARDGDDHRRMRTAMNKPFSPKGLSATSAGAMAASALGVLTERWVRQRGARVLPDIQEAALEIIFRMLGVGTHELPQWRVQYRALLLANLGFKPRFPGSPAWRAARAKSWIDGRFGAAVAAARSGRPSDGLLGAMAVAEDDDGHVLSERELVDNLRLLALGGHETISSTMAWMTIALAARPKCWDALAAETARIDAPPVDLEAARGLPYAEAIFRETVRMHPPFGAITRVAEEDVELGGRTIPKGTNVAVDLWTASRDPAVFDEPHSFRPERWLGRSGPPTQLEIVQFGAGPHFCLGYHLAWLEAVQFAAALGIAAQKARVRPRLDGAEPVPIYLPTEHPPPKTRVRFDGS